jgi:alkanesulfonate monooxygenase SsuD/methylene tetrahydromethanopterin reductase-like flavin-dependent oxidoreductase (luciferase family)
MFTMRFDMRAPARGAPIRDLYAAALEMCAWAEGRGCKAVQVSEHHASPDGYLPAPLVLASAIAARTKTVPIQVAALLVPLHDPIELAEQMAVLDVLSGGRVSYVCAIGYREEEYAMFGRDMKSRGRRLEECIGAIRRAFAGDPFAFEGRSVHVTPRPATPGGPPLLMGGSSPAAVRRAARLGMGMITQGGGPELQELYLQTCREAGTAPGLFVNPPLSGSVTSAFVARDPDRAWAEMGPYLLHDARMYASWLGDQASTSKSAAASVAELRAEQGSYRIFSIEEAVAHVRAQGLLLTQPLCGGLPPHLAWPSLELLVGEVLPALARAE